MNYIMFRIYGKNTSEKAEFLHSRCLSKILKMRIALLYREARKEDGSGDCAYCKEKVEVQK